MLSLIISHDFHITNLTDFHLWSTSTEVSLTLTLGSDHYWKNDRVGLIAVQIFLFFLFLLLFYYPIFLGVFPKILILEIYLMFLFFTLISIDPTPSNYWDGPSVKFYQFHMMLAPKETMAHFAHSVFVFIFADLLCCTNVTQYIQITTIVEPIQNLGSVCLSVNICEHWIDGVKSRRDQESHSNINLYWNMIMANYSEQVFLNVHENFLGHGLLKFITICCFFVVFFQRRRRKEKRRIAHCCSFNYHNGSKDGLYLNKGQSNNEYVRYVPLWAIRDLRIRHHVVVQQSHFSFYNRISEWNQLGSSYLAHGFIVSKHCLGLFTNFLDLLSVSKTGFWTRIPVWNQVGSYSYLWSIFDLVHGLFVLLFLNGTS